MRRPWRGLAAGLLVASLAAIPGSGAGTDHTERARRFVTLLADAELKAAVATFDETMKAALPEAKLGGIWASLVAQAGAYRGQEAARREMAGAYEVVFVTCRFERALLDLKVVFDAQGRVAGFFVVPVQPPWRAPSYCRPDAFHEREVTVGSGEWSLPGTLSVPVGPGPHPAVVLVHGSGPQDRDETIGPNKPFADLACGLASRGVAVLRYEKRTKRYAARLAASSAALTVKEETIDDALAAVRLVRSARDLDPQRVFVLGHSLGGMLLPRIGREDPLLRGLVVLAGTTRPLEDVMLEQLAYLSSLPGTSAEAREQIAAVQAGVAEVKALTPAKAGSSERVMGVPASYWLDLREYRPAAAARSLTQPMLVLQGGRDYQVTLADFQDWRDALGTRPDVELKLYPDLNHLFATGQGKSVPSEYDRPGHVSEEVVTDIASWLGRVGPRAATQGGR